MWENRGGNVIEENYSCDAANQLYALQRSDNSVTTIAYDNGNTTSVVTQAGGAVTENMICLFDFD